MSRAPVAPWRRLARAVAAMGFIATLALAATAVSARAEGAQEEALRRRVHRFYVLSFLNRHGEMWEMFAPSLQQRLGGDRKEYVRDARAAGFELYQSRVESIDAKAGKAVVEVDLQVKLPGATSLSWRRHRMVWRDEGGAWLYAGSIDITRESGEESEAALEELEELEALPGTGLGSDAGELLPQQAPVATPAPAAAKTRPPADDGVRWDLVAVPPPGGSQPVVEARAPAPDAQPAPAPAVTVAPAPAVAAAPAPAPSGEAAYVPPERATPAAALPAPLPVPSATDEDPDADPLVVLVQKAAEGNALRRARALAKVRTSLDPALPGLIAPVFAAAPADSQAVFLDRLAALGGPQHLPLALAALTSPAPAVRAAAARAAGELGGPEQQSVLLPLLGDAHEDVVLAGLEALGRLGGDPSGALQPILSSPASSPDRLVAAATAAGRARAMGCEAALLALVDRRAPAMAVAAALEALGKLASPAAIARLTRMIEDHGMIEGPGLVAPARLLAARALALTGAPEAGRVLARALADFPDASSSADVDRVAETGETGALLALVSADRPNVRRRAADIVGRSLGESGEREAAIAALEAARNAETDDRTMVALQSALERLRAQAPSGR